MTCLTSHLLPSFMTTGVLSFVLARFSGPTSHSLPSPCCQLLLNSLYTSARVILWETQISAKDVESNRLRNTASELLSLVFRMKG